MSQSYPFEATLKICVAGFSLQNEVFGCLRNNLSKQVTVLLDMSHFEVHKSAGYDILFSLLIKSATT